MAKAKAKKERKSAEQIRSEITDKIVQSIKDGCPPWRQPWAGGENGGWPTNFVSKRRYTGINPIILMGSGYTSKFWGTGWQWSSIGGISKGNRHEWGAHIQKGEKCTYIVFWSMIPKKDKDGKVELNKEGKEKKMPLLRTSPVFNVEQIAAPAAEIMEAKRDKPELLAHAKSLRIKGVADRWTKKKLSVAIHDEINRRLSSFRAIEDATVLNTDPDFEPAEALIEATQADIRHKGTRAFYRGRPDDFIQVPPKPKFNSMPDYYETVFHELFHWSEDKDRAGRHKDHNYAFGELVAELGACFILAEIGVPLAEKMIESSQGYLKDWLSSMGGDHKYLFKASTQASKVADHLLSYIGMENAPYQSEDEKVVEDEEESERANAAA